MPNKRCLLSLLSGRWGCLLLFEGKGTGFRFRSSFHPLSSGRRPLGGHGSYPSCLPAKGLLDAAEESFPNADFVFAVPPKAEPAASVLKAIGAHYWYAEHVMAMDAPDFLTPSGETVSPSCQIQWPDGCRTSPGDDISACFYDNQTLTASCRLNFSAGTEGSACCIYQVLVPEVLRNRGWGFRFLTALISCLIQKKVRHFLLQVSGDNLPAMALYKKTGFRITETLWYYLY